jgi:hypothetical protein
MSSFFGAAMGAPSAQVTALNNQIQDFSKNMTSEAMTEFGGASTTFNNLMGPLQRIVQGGPSQAGWSQAQTNAFNTQAMQLGASKARDLGAAAGTGASAAGGGNTPAMGGAGRSAVLNAQAQAEAATSAEISRGTIASGEAGRENFFKAAGEEKELPGVYSTANEATKSAATEQLAAEKNQQQIDTAKNWWQPMVMKGVAAGLGVATGGASMPFTNAALSKAGSGGPGSRINLNFGGGSGTPVAPSGDSSSATSLSDSDVYEQ